MIIKNTYKKIKIHYFYYLVAIIAIITGLFKDLIVFTTLIVIHEIGHVIMAIYYNWEIEEIIILPFGGLTMFKTTLNKPIKEEFLILIMGPLLQMIFYTIANYLSPSYLLTNYHYAILLFNLIPIIPLDGSKLINIILNKVLPFKISHKINIYISIALLLLIGIILSKELLLFLILLNLLIKVIIEYKNHNYIFNKFLFERYLYKIKFSKIKTIKSLKFNKMFRDYSHVFLIDNKRYKEGLKLAEKFDKVGKL